MSGIPISTDTVQAITEEELQTREVKEQMKEWFASTSPLLEAKSVFFPLADDVPQHSRLDVDDEDEEF